MSIEPDEHEEDWWHFADDEGIPFSGCSDCLAEMHDDITYID